METLLQFKTYNKDKKEKHLDAKRNKGTAFQNVVIIITLKCLFYYTYFYSISTFNVKI